MSWKNFASPPSELMRQPCGMWLSVASFPSSEGDEVLIATTRERLVAPQRVKVALDDL